MVPLGLLVSLFSFCNLLELVLFLILDSEERILSWVSLLARLAPEDRYDFASRFVRILREPNTNHHDAPPCPTLEVEVGPSSYVI